MENNVEELRQELIALFERHGGVNRVAAKTGLNSQRLVYVRSGRSMIKTDAIMAIINAYPEEKRLRELMAIPNLVPVLDGDEVASAYVARLEAENEGYRQENDILRKQVDHLWKMLLPKVAPELNFLKASSQTTGLDIMDATKKIRPLVKDATPCIIKV